MYATLIFGQKVEGTYENINLVIVYDYSLWYYNETQTHQTPWSSDSHSLSASYVIFFESQDQECFVVVAIGIGFHNPANKDDANEYVKVDRKKVPWGINLTKNYRLHKKVYRWRGGLPRGGEHQMV